MHNCIGIALCALLGFLEGIGWISLLGHIGSGIGDMGELITVTLLAGGMLGLIRHNGGIDLILKGLTKGIKGKKGAEFSIGGLVALTNLCTANNTISIITIVAILAIWIPVDLERNGTVRDDLGLTSITYTSSWSSTMNCMLNSPTMPISRPRRRV